MSHPLLTEIEIDTCDNAKMINERITKLGLLTKQNGNLLIVKYPRELKYSQKNYILASRGLIIDTTTKKIVNYSLEGALDEEAFLNKVAWGDMVIEQCIDGTLLNLFYHDGQWRVSTKFCIDAAQSKFKSNLSFRQMLDQAVNINDLNLDPKFSYSILLCHVENRIVSPVEVNKVFHIESVNIITGTKAYQEIGLPSASILQCDGIAQLKINSKSRLDEYVSNLPWSNPGVMLYSYDRRYRCKITNPNYKLVKDLTDNQPNISYLVLETILNNDKDNKWGSLVKYYPEYVPIQVAMVEKYITYINTLHDYYMKCKVNVNREFIELPKCFKKSIVDLHMKFKSERSLGNTTFKMTKQQVKIELDKYDVSLLYSLIMTQ